MGGYGAPWSPIMGGVLKLLWTCLVLSCLVWSNLPLWIGRSTNYRTFGRLLKATRKPAPTEAQGSYSPNRCFAFANSTSDKRPSCFQAMSCLRLPIRALGPSELDCAGASPTRATTSPASNVPCPRPRATSGVTLRGETCDFGRPWGPETFSFEGG